MIFKASLKEEVGRLEDGEGRTTMEITWGTEGSYNKKWEKWE